VEFTPVVAVVGVALGGGLFGSAYAEMAKRLPLPRVVAGAFCGFGLWAFAELAYWQAPGRRQRWSAPPRNHLPALVELGVEVALLAEVPRLLPRSR